MTNNHFRFNTLVTIVLGIVIYTYSCKSSDKSIRILNNHYVESLSDKDLFFRKEYIQFIDTLSSTVNEKIESVWLLEVFTSHTTSASFVNILVVKYPSSAELYFSKFDMDKWVLVYKKNELPLNNIDKIELTINEDNNWVKSDMEGDEGEIYSQVMMRYTQLDSQGKKLILSRNDSDIEFYNWIVEAVDNL